MTMAIKQISIDIEAYELLQSAKGSQRESFSQVIKRAIHPPNRGTAGKLLETTQNLAKDGFVLPEEALDFLENAQKEDLTAPDHWKKS